ncbi:MULTISPECIES: hypothetical protein [unclassified Myroides]|uniref:hypothetical protein n=1 Tax=unclassified Myroides TaxID=2642485 RepID=UPI003D2F644E
MRQGLIVSGLNHVMHMVDDLWKIENNRATLIDESSDGIYIESNGSIFNLSEYDFTNNMAAAESIVQYYSKDYALSSYYEGGNFELKGGGFFKL